MSSPSDLPGDGQPDDDPFALPWRGAVAPRSGPRHLAAPGARPSWWQDRDVGSSPRDDGARGVDAGDRTSLQGSHAVQETDGADADDPDAGDPDADDDHGGSIARTVVEWLGVIACGILIALAAQAVLVQVFYIPSASMVPTLDVDDRVVVNKLAYKVHDVHRGDVVVFERPPAADNGNDGIKDLIKRVVAVGGDTLEAVDGQVYVNGERIDEPYLVDGTPTSDLPRQEIPEGHVFVMGDNRTNSEDSRVFGPIDEDDIVGRAVVKVLPVDDVGWL